MVSSRGAGNLNALRLRSLSLNRRLSALQSFLRMNHSLESITDLPNPGFEIYTSELCD